MPTWETTASLPTARYGLAAATDAQGRVYAIGGTSGSNYFSTVERFDPTSGSWSAVASTSTRHAYAASAVDGQGRVYVIGGESTTGTRTATVERYDPSSNSWTTVASLPAALEYLAAAADSQGRIYAIGGYGSTSYTNSVYRYDPAANSWATVASLPAQLGYLSAASDSSGRIYAIGGYNINGAQTAVYRYDPAANSWTPVASLPSARYRAAAVYHSQGFIYLMGGDPGYLTTVIRYSPTNNAWESFASLSTGRRDLAAAVDGQGRVYAIGGYNNSVLGTVERVTPNTAPNAPTLTGPANNATLDRGIVQRFTWQFSDPDTGDSQSKFDLRYSSDGGATWTTVTQTTPNTYYDFAAGALAAGSYQWQVRTYDSQGVVGPWSTSSFFTAADAPVPATITAPTSGGTVSNTATVTWSTPVQDAYQVRRVADNAGTANTGTVYSDTGQVNDTATRSISLSFPTNDRWEHVQVRIKSGGLWSAWSDVRVNVSYTPPATPTVSALGDPDTATIIVDITNPAPGTGQPTVVSNDLYVSAPNVPEYRAATGLPVNGSWTYRPASGVTYTFRAVAVAVNGTTASS